MADTTTQTESYYLISWVARRYRVHPQTLRLYEREGLLRPSRTRGNTRLYSSTDLARLETILGTWESTWRVWRSSSA